MKVEILKGIKGYGTIRVTNAVKQRAFFMHSIFDPQEEAEIFIVQKELIYQKCVYVVCGCGLGYHIKLLLGKISTESRVFVVEPCLDKAMGFIIKDYWKNDQWWLDKRLAWILGPDIRHIAGCIFAVMQRYGISMYKTIKYFPACIIDEQFYQNVFENLQKKTFQLLHLDYGFRIKSVRVKFENALKNLPYIINSYGIRDLENKFQETTALVVSAGPSLNKCIESIKSERNKFLLICVGSAVGALYKEGIIPDFHVMLDPYVENKFDVEGYLHPQTVLIAPYFLPNEIIKMQKGKTCYYWTDDHGTGLNVLDCIKNYLPQTATLESNVSVSTVALSFTKFLGCHKTIIVGQDMAFSSDKTHAEGVTAGSYVGEDAILDEYLDIRGWNGEILKTTVTLQEVCEHLRIWFAKNKDRIFINASEGGAYIDGIENIPFLQSIEGVTEMQFGIQTKISDLLQKNNCADIRKIIADLCYRYREIKKKVESTGVLIEEKFATFSEWKIKMNELESLSGYELLRPLWGVWCELMELNVNDSNWVKDAGEYIGKLRENYELAGDKIKELTNSAFDYE